MTATDQADVLAPSRGEPEGLRERKKAKTRRALEDAALDLFQRRGFDATTVEQIAGACEVSPRTFFRYYAAKEDVLFADAGEKLAALVAALEARPAAEAPIDSLRAALLTLVDNYVDQRERRKAIEEIVRATPSLRARGSERQDDWNDAAVEVLLRRLPGAASTTDRLDVRLMVVASSAALRVALQTWVEDSEAELEQLIELVFDRLAAGFRA